MTDDTTTLQQQFDERLTEHREFHKDHKQTYQLLGSLTLVAIGIWIGAQVFGGDPGFTTNVYTEALSVLVTVLVIKWFDDRRARNQRKQELFLQLGSQSNDFALEAKRQLEQLGWLNEALQQKQFPRAGWLGMVLGGADLTNANLVGDNPTNAKLLFANLTNANLQGANLTDARFDEDTRLPDGTRWTPDTDMTRFTDYSHPQFWRSSHPASPAYRGR